LQMKLVPETARSTRVIQVSMGQQKPPHAIQRDCVGLQILDQMFGFDSAAGIDEHEFPAAIDGINIAVIFVCDRAAEKAAANEVHAWGNFQSSRSLE
jgi:hypothetical protein